jgi:hypothetical protein
MKESSFELRMFRSSVVGGRVVVTELWLRNVPWNDSVLQDSKSNKLIQKKVLFPTAALALQDGRAAIERRYQATLEQAEIYKSQLDAFDVGDCKVNYLA